MSGLGRVAALGVGVFVLTSAAEAQTSLFSQTPMGGPPATAPAAPVAADETKPRPKPKPRGPVPARSLSVTNVSGSAVTELIVEADGKSARLPRELGHNETATLRLPAFRSCGVTIAVTFQRAGEADQYEQDICRDRKVRLTN